MAPRARVRRAYLPERNWPMSTTLWILSGFVEVALLFWFIAKGSRGRQRKDDAQREIKELRHVVTQMAMEKHHSRHGKA